ncbi:acyl-CoA N-acyltransferase [Testicularia cyperi]|uniref:Acyl-CoA N-acyltransferase n=1 Tax=Testicularia cyperi TaxID=1882483 RepID=A0A317XLE8_9BASI|nr:acyl-CoA N-acyltransferase [Testicularia cyperi]
MTDSVVEIETATAVGKPASLTVKTVSWNDPDAVALRNQQRIDIADRYERVDSEPGTPPSADDITMFCVAYSGSKAVGCGGLRLLDHASAEIKRMFVLREARGTGAAAAVLVYLEQHSKQLGLHRLLLETGDKLFDAIRFYTRSGYTRIPNFGYYQGVDTSICMEKVL